MLFRRLLPVLMAAALAMPAAHAQSTNMQCPYTYLCVNTNPTTNDPNGYDVLLGGTSTADGTNTAIGVNSSVATDATMPGGTAIGYLSRIGTSSTGFAGGAWSQINNGMSGVAIGTQALVTYYANPNGAMPTGATINPLFAGGIAIGPNATSGGVASTSVGSGAQADGNYDTVLGAGALSGGNSVEGVNAGGNVVIGYKAQAPYLAQNDVVLGNQASVGNAAVNSVVLGANTTTNDSNVVAVGSRRITQVADGVDTNDAVNVGQLDSAISGIQTGTSDPLAVHYDAGSNNGSVTLQGAAGTQIHNVAAGTQGSDAVNLSQLDNAIAGIPPSNGNGGSAPVWIASTDTTTAASAQGQETTTIGAGAQAGNANTAFNTAIGAGAQAGTTGSAQAGTGGQATAVGANAQANSLASEAIGYGAQTTAPFSTAIGNYALADQANTVSFGNDQTGNTRRLVNLADGIDPTDAMTVGQGQQIASVFGGGASFSGGVMSAPSYIFTSPYAAGTYNNVGTALNALDNGQNALWSAINNLPTGGTGGGTPGPVGPTGPQGPQGPAGSAANVAAGKNIVVTQNGSTATVSVSDTPTFTSVTTTNGSSTTTTTGDGVTITPASGNAVSLSGTGLNNGNNVISGVAAGTISTDAANVGQVQAAQQAAVSTSEQYTDQQVAAAQDWSKSYTDQKFNQARSQANAAGATASAIGMLSLSAQGIEQRDRLVMSTAVYNGSGAIGLGFNHVSESGRVSVAIGGAFGQHGGAVGASLGIGIGD